MFAHTRRAAVPDNANCGRPTSLTSPPLGICCQILFLFHTNHLERRRRASFWQDVMSPLWIGRPHTSLCYYSAKMCCLLRSECTLTLSRRCVFCFVFFFMGQICTASSCVTCSSPSAARNSSRAAVVVETSGRSGLQLLSTTEACWDVWWRELVNHLPPCHIQSCVICFGFNQLYKNRNLMTEE